MMAVTCPDCGGSAHIETFERATCVGGPTETVRLVRCSVRWREHAHVLPDGTEDPPPYVPPVRQMPKRPAERGPRLTPQEWERESRLLGVFRGIREDNERQQFSAPDNEGLPCVGPDEFHTPPASKEAPMPTPAPKYPKDVRMRAIQLVLDGKTHRQAAAELGATTSVISYWMSDYHKRHKKGLPGAQISPRSEAVAEPVSASAANDDNVAQACVAAAAARSRTDAEAPSATVAGVESTPWDEYNHALDRLGSVSLERLARIEDPEEAASILRLVFRGQHARLAELGVALVGGAA